FLEEQTGDDIVDLDEIGEDDISADPKLSATLENAVNDIASGGSSVEKVMKNMKANAQDHLRECLHPMVRRLGRVCGKNSSRDWWRALKGGPEMEWIEIPVKYTDLADGDDKYRLEKWPLLDPHSIIAFLEKSGLKIPPISVREYWHHHRTFGEPWAQHDETDRIPMGIYGDSAKCQTEFGFVNLVGIFISLVLWKPMSVRFSRFLVFAIPEQSLWGSKTLRVVYRRLAWSINSLIHGEHPRAGVYGEDLNARLRELSGKPFQHRYALTEIRGDWAWHKKVWRFKRCSWAAINMCHQCPAKSSSTNSADLYWMFESNSWDDHHFTTEQFIAERMPETGICPLLGVTNFHPSTIRWCLMHVVNLGILYTVNGSALNLLVQGGWFGNEPGINSHVKLARAHRDFKAFISKNKIQCSQPDFTPKMIYKKGGIISLTAKAYNGRVILAWLDETVYLASQDQQFANLDERTLMIAAALRHMNRFLTEMEHAGRYLSEQQANSIFESGKQFLQIYRSLAIMSVRAGKFELGMRPKVHALWHMLWMIKKRRTNVRLWSGFVDEDAMSWLKRTYFGAHPGWRSRWIIRVSKLRIWQTHLKVRRFNQQVADRLKRGR
ncbi:unnamed protein product, partial [Cladocopium goreaui]